MAFNNINFAVVDIVQLTQLLSIGVLRTTISHPSDRKRGVTSMHFTLHSTAEYVRTHHNAHVHVDMPHLAAPEDSVQLS